MPSISKAQRGYMGAALARKRAGKSRLSDPKMSTEQLKHFASTKGKGTSRERRLKRAKIAAMRAGH